MRLRDRGEFDWIERIARRSRGARDGRVPLGIGDDAALLRPRAGEDVVVTTDTQVEDVHFRWRTQDARRVGARAVEVCLSDLAAMGARPLGLVMALAAPPDLPAERVEGLLRGITAAARRCDCPLVGGNLSRAGETSLTPTAVGAVRRGRALRRDAGRAGDRLLVTGTLGGVALELALAERDGGRVTRVPRARLRAGQALARIRGVGACIDLSDGLLADLGHVLRASGVGAEVDPERLPIPRGFARACAEAGLDPLALATRGGEDYELLFSVRPGAFSAERLSRSLGVRVREIGHLTRRRGLHGLTAATGAKTGSAGDAGGWRHF